MNTAPFDAPIYVTRPVLPDLTVYERHLADIWRSCTLTNGGPKHAALEQRVAAYLRAPHASLFVNGTISLIVALQALRVTGECITSPFTFPATTHALTWMGVRPIFCDIDPVTLTIDPDKIEGLITLKTTAILGVHVFGVPCHVHAIQEIADRYGLRVIYDGAHAFGTEIEDRGIGTFGDATSFSFHATKLFHTAEGGALAVCDAKVKARVDLLKNFGIQDENTVVMPGINGKMSELSAALGLCVLDLVEDERRRRAEVACVYRARLGALGGVTLPPVLPGVRPSQQYFAIRTPKRDRLQTYLRSRNVFTRRYFYPLTSEAACYRQVPTSGRENLPVAHQVASEVLCLPFYGDLGVENAARICDMIGELP